MVVSAGSPLLSVIDRAAWPILPEKLRQPAQALNRSSTIAPSPALMSPQSMSFAQLKPVISNTSQNYEVGSKNRESRHSIHNHKSVEPSMGEKEKRAVNPLRFFTKLNRSVRKRILHRKFGEEW